MIPIFKIEIFSDQNINFVKKIFSVYLQADPVVVLDRIKKRGRPEEASISLEFLQGLNRLHEDWLIHGNSTARVPSKR